MQNIIKKILFIFYAVLIPLPIGVIIVVSIFGYFKYDSSINAVFAGIFGYVILLLYSIIFIFYVIRDIALFIILILT